MVATVIMAIAVTGLMSAISTSLRNAARLTDYDRAALFGRQKMDELLIADGLPEESRRSKEPGARKSPAGQPWDGARASLPLKCRPRRAGSAISGAHRARNLVDERATAPDALPWRVSGGRAHAAGLAAVQGGP